MCSMHCNAADAVCRSYRAATQRVRLMWIVEPDVDNTVPTVLGTAKGNPLLPPYASHSILMAGPQRVFIIL